MLYSGNLNNMVKKTLDRFKKKKVQILPLLICSVLTMTVVLNNIL